MFCLPPPPPPPTKRSSKICVLFSVVKEGMPPLIQNLAPISRSNAFLQYTED